MTAMLPARASAHASSAACFRLATNCRRSVVAAARPGQDSGNNRHRSTAPNQAEEVIDERGWWEKPEEASLQAYAIQPLEPWQIERLEQAFAADGRRKMKVQALAAELDIDRVRVISWAKEFAQKPAGEREAVLAKRRAEVEQSRIRGERQRVAEAAVNLQPHPEDQQGFIPFYTRKEMGMLEGRKRLPADVLRTLESIYSRTPFPSNDVIKGVWELHRLTRETVLEWLTHRREADGISSSTQKRRERQRGGSAAVFIEDGRFENDRGLGSEAGPSGRQQGSGGNVLMDLMADVLPAAAKPAEPQVVSMNRAEMAALRSSLPSRKKFKGRKLAEKMGIKTDDEDTAALQIGDVRFVEDASGKQAAKWTQALAVQTRHCTSTCRQEAAAAGAVVAGGAVR